MALKRHQPYIIGIAGSVGKSSTRNALFAILKDKAQTKMVGNSETGIPLGILGIAPYGYTTKNWVAMIIRAPFGLNYLKGTKYLIVEMGIDEPYPPKNMEYLLTILTPQIAIDLNVSATHTMQFEKILTDIQKDKMPDAEKRDLLVRKIAEEDSKIITRSGCKTGIYKADDPLLREIIPKNTPSSTSLQAFGEHRQNIVSYTLYAVNSKGTSFGFLITLSDNKQQEIILRFSDAIYPQEYREVFAAAIMAALEIGLSITECKSNLEKNFLPPKGRSSLLKGINGSIIIDSSYNASKSAVLAFLKMTKQLKAGRMQPVVFLFGDMRELGEEARQEHIEVAEQIPEVVDYLYLVGPLTRKFILPIIQKNEEYFSEVRWFDTSVRAGEYLRENLPMDAVVLVKGSQNTIFLEEAIKYILKDKADQRKLCRQEPYWMKLKSAQDFQTVNELKS